MRISLRVLPLHISLLLVWITAIDMFIYCLQVSRLHDVVVVLLKSSHGLALGALHLSGSRDARGSLS